ncbi:MAG: PQQ-dependent sugar dehydrogenase, partial [Burkholderiales bacterium]|nr:PQQ-dependent sugar dehydrogenase [Opitutaceae bacterium]
GSEVQLLNLPNLVAWNHNGGALHFGPDGKLYIAVGENGVPSYAQSLTTPLGKILRINSNGTIPTDNPFYGQTTGINRAIWAMGLRNPFNFAFDRTDGTMFINDVGQASWEEINEGVAGANYGWPTTEGTTTDPRFVSPFFSYNHNNGCAIIGSAFYRPTSAQFPAAYTGQFFYGDYCGGWIRRINPATGAVTNFATGIADLVDIRVADDGSLYYLTRGTSATTGAVYRVRYTQAPGISTQPTSRTVSQGQSTTFTVTVSGTQPLSYQWQRNNANIAGATAASYTRVAALADNGTTYRVIVTNGFGSATSNAATLTVNSTANPTNPVATITQPTAGTLYSGGTALSFAGTGTDTEDGTLPASAFSWTISLHHDTHTHPFYGPTTGIRNGTFTIPNDGETSSNVFYRISLTVTDLGGRTHTVTRDVVPRTVAITLASNPTGARLTLDGQPVTAPYTFTGVVGVVRAIGVTSPQTIGGQSYTYQSWSDGGAATHNITTPAAATTYTATFTTGGGTSTLMEAEDLARTTNGAASLLEVHAGASGGEWVALEADGIGDTIDFTTPSLPSGTYDLKLRYKAYPARGRLTLAVDGVQVGGTVDQYTAVSAGTYVEVTLGSVSYSATSTHGIRLAVNGRNAASTSYRLSADSFTFVRTGSNPSVIANGTYKIINRNSGKALDAAGAKIVDGTPINQYTYNAANNQRWILENRGNGEFSIVGVASGKALDVIGGNTADATKTQLWTYTGVTNQKWTFTPTDGGFYRLSPVHAPGSALEVEGDSVANSALIQISTYDGGNSQQWSVTAP